MIINRRIFQKSIAARLLRVVFGTYLIFTLAITAGQLFYEYKRTKSEIAINMLGVVQGYIAPMSTALWNLDDATLGDTLDGMLTSKILVGVKVFADQEPETMSLGLGYIETEDGMIQRVEEENEVVESYDAASAGFTGKLLKVPFDIRRNDKLLGTGLVFSREDVVLQKVQQGFVSIITTAFMKTFMLWLIFLFFSNKLIARPLGELREETKEFDPDTLTGDKDTDLVGERTERTDEVGVLQNALFDMRLTISEKISKLKNLNQVSSEIAAAKTPEETIVTATRAILQQFDAPDAEVCFRSENSNRSSLFFRVKNTEPAEVEASDSQSCRMLASCEVQLDKRRENVVTVGLFDGSDAIGISISYGQHRLGAICVRQGQEGINLIAENISYLEQIGRMTAYVLEDQFHSAYIQRQNVFLEDKVAERTEHLRVINAEHAMILANLHQGVLTFGEEMKVQVPYSHHVEVILESDRIKEAPVMELLFAQADITSSQISEVNAASCQAFGLPVYAFSLNRHIYPNELKIKTASKTKHLELDWVPIANHKDEVERILVTFRDISEFKELEKANQEQQEELEIITQVTKITVRRFLDFHKNSMAILTEAKSLVKNSSSERGVITDLFIKMHTVKGNARTLHLRKIVQEAFVAEKYYSELLEQKDPIKWSVPRLMTDLNNLEQQLRSYEQVVEKTLGNLGQGSDGVERFMRAFDDFVSESDGTLAKMAQDPNKENLQLRIAELSQVRSLIDFTPLVSMLDEEIASLAELSAVLGISTPGVSIMDNEIILARSRKPFFKNCFMHLMRNSLAHGFKQKAAHEVSNTIDIYLSEENGNLQLRYCDSGPGLAIGELRSLGLERGLIEEGASDEEIARLVFHSGISTQEGVDDVAGQGHGMCAVKAFVEESNGRLEIVFKGPMSSEGYRPFELLMVLRFAGFAAYGVQEKGAA